VLWLVVLLLLVGLLAALRRCSQSRCCFYVCLSVCPSVCRPVCVCLCPSAHKL